MMTNARSAIIQNKLFNLDKKHLKNSLKKSKGIFHLRKRMNCMPKYKKLGTKMADTKFIIINENSQITKMKKSILKNRIKWSITFLSLKAFRNPNATNIKTKKSTKINNKMSYKIPSKNIKSLTKQQKNR